MSQPFLGWRPAPSKRPQPLKKRGKWEKQTYIEPSRPREREANQIEMEVTALRLETMALHLEAQASHLREEVAMEVHQEACQEVRWEVVGAGQEEGTQERIWFPHHKSG